MNFVCAYTIFNKEQFFQFDQNITITVAITVTITTPGRFFVVMYLEFSAHA